ncbi:MAG: hypothetical protein Q7S20_08065 [Gemmatimonadaceae bacterium]|nr:hypothetical protein [Gemmatimonadaceae bacterium]
MGWLDLFGPSERTIAQREQQQDAVWIGKLLRHKQAALRRKAAEALARMGTPRALRELTIALGESETHTGERDLALSVFRSLELEALKDAFDSAVSRSSYMRNEALKALRAIETPASLALVVELCKSADGDTSKDALDLLVRWDVSRALPILTDELGSGAEQRQKRAVSHLKSLARTRPEILTQASAGLCEALAAQLRSAKGWDRQEAASVLVTAGWSPQTPEDQLLFAVARSDFSPFPDLRPAAPAMAEALFQSGLLTSDEFDRVQEEFPSRDAVILFCQKKNYSALGRIRKRSAEFDDLMLASVVQRLVKKLAAAEYFDGTRISALLAIGHPHSAQALRRALERGACEHDSTLEQNVARFVEAHKDLCGPPEQAYCSICHAQKSADEMKLYGRATGSGGGKIELLWFCKGKCWDARGREIGSRLGGGCPFWDDGICKPAKPAGQPAACSIEVNSHLECHVYRMR